MELIVVLHNIRSTYNVGAILRTCEGFGVSEVVYSGYTPRYDDPNLLPHLREKLNRQIAKSALGAEKLVKQTYLSDGILDRREKQSKTGSFGFLGDVAGESLCDELLTFLEKCAIIGYKVVGLENNLTDKEVSRRIILGQEQVNLGEKILLVLGEEVNGIPTEIREKMQYFLEIPMRGQKESFNVSVAAGIAIFALTAKTIN